MSFIDDLTNTINSDQSAALVHALLTNSSRSNFIRPISSSSYNTNWSISHIPGPPSSFLTPFFSSSLLSSTTTTTTATVITETKYYPFWLLVIVAVFGGVTSVLTVLGNILVMLAFFLDRQIRQPTNYFILSLSVSDFLIGLLSMPILTIYIYAKEWPLNAIICDIWLSLDYTVCLTSIYTVLFITIDRFCSVKMPAKYRKWRTRRKINIMIAVTWAVPTLIFFTSTMVYPRVRSISNMQNGVCDVQWNKNHVFNLCLTIGYFWTTLFVMIILYIFIYGVASNLERKSRENARKMSSLVGNAMTQIGVGIGVNKSPTKTPIDKRNHTNRKIDSTTMDEFDDEDPQNLLAQSVINTQNSSNSSDQRRIGGVDDDNSNSFESHSDFDLTTINENKSRTSNNTNEKTSRQKNRRGMSVNWGNSSTTPINTTSTRTSTNRRSRQNRGHSNQKHSSNVKFFATSMAHSLYRNPIRLSGLSSTSKSKGTNSITNKNLIQTTSNQQQMPTTLTPIPSEPELLTCRIYPPPQPRPESLAIMPEELFYQRLKARQSPLITDSSKKSSLNVNNQLSTNFPSTSSFLLDKHCIEDVTYSTTNQILSTNSDHTITNQITPPPSPEEQQKKLNETKNNPIELSTDEEEEQQQQQQQQQQQEEEQEQHISSPIRAIISSSGDSSDESWRLLNSNSSLDEHIPYIDETDFEDLGYILHRRRVPPIDSNEPIHEETIVYKSPFYIKNKNRSKSSMISLNNTTNDNGINRKIYEIYGNHPDAHKAILESPIFDNVELITYACTKSNSSPIHHCSLRNVPREVLLKTMSQPTSIPPYSNNSNDKHTTSSIIFVSKAKTSTSPPISTIKQTQQITTPSIQNADVERALIDFYQCSQINDTDDYLINNNDNSESEDLEYSLSNYNEICEETSSLLRLNEQHSSAFIDDESITDDYSTKTKQIHSRRHSYTQNNNHFMKTMMLNKTRRNLTIDTTSDDRTTTNSFSLNTYSQDYSVDKIFQSDSSTSYKQQYNISSPNQQISQHNWRSSSSTATTTRTRTTTSSSSSSSCQDKQLPLLLLRASSPKHFLTAVEKKRNTSSDSDAITTTTTLTNSTQYGGHDIDKNKQKITDSISQDVLRAFNKLNATTITDEPEVEKIQTNEINTIINKTIDIDTKYHSISDTLTRDNDTSGYGSHDDPSSITNRISSKVTFESLITQNSVPSSPKTKDQSIMTHIDLKERLNQTINNNNHEQIQDSNENKNGRLILMSEGTITSGSTSAKSSVKELVQNQKTTNHRKSKSQNRARKALRTITFILGAFVVCWTPWHIYSAIHSLCESCKHNWVFSNPMFHCFYFLCYLNSPINPFCYALANQQFKKTFTRILKLDLRRL
ncbi:unnamed protein product [Rotaria sordida]|uniref:G-protein coupled receptors family 1 profile domain-containing protein n=1 Tax=Rotaria sordida TaxID=392033 RepID=A0A815BG64_9BILA|nr:unnamed protein product [Rotaria sordida]CAF1269061.1 unnamed protein product [Rotaria sordida]